MSQSKYSQFVYIHIYISKISNTFCALPFCDSAVPRLGPLTPLSASCPDFGGRRLWSGCRSNYRSAGHPGEDLYIFMGKSVYSCQFINHSLSFYIVVFGGDIFDFFLFFFVLQAMKSYPGPSLLTRRACCVASMPDSRSACSSLMLSVKVLVHIQIFLLDGEQTGMKNV